LQALAEAAEANPGLPMIVLQHNPVYPGIESEYPYVLANSDDVCDSYRRNGVILSLSGHYHHGRPLSARDGVDYYTVPALCAPPCRFAVVDVGAGGVDVHEYALAGNDRPA
jgi:hypothetical protein